MEIVLVSAKKLLQVSFRRQINRTIMTSAQRCEKILEEMKATNPYYEKYADKIAKLQQTSPEELMSRLEQKRESSKPKQVPDEIKGGKYSQLLNPKKDMLNPSDTKDKLLDDVMKIDLIKDKSAEEIKSIWESYHRQKTLIAAIVPTDEYIKLQEKGSKFPTFLLPLPRSQGYEFIMCQFQSNEIHFTPLLYYQVHKENAPECLTLTYYTEFIHNKGIVLMRGEYNTEVLDAKEALCLANQILLYYGQNDEDKNRLLRTFNHRPDEFRHMELIKQIENLSL